MESKISQAFLSLRKAQLEQEDPELVDNSETVAPFDKEEYNKFHSGQDAVLEQILESANDIMHACNELDPGFNSEAQFVYKAALSIQKAMINLIRSEE